ncbi:MAG: class I SAM-dependent rRNA methyltransferase [Gemmatimonadaceae bacterium]
MSASERRPAATVSSRGARRWDSGHPWIFRSDIVKPPDSTAGCVEVQDQRGRALGVALWSPKSEISLRLLTRDTDAAIDRAWWKARIEAAAARRTALTPVTNAWRIVHGEGDGLPSLVIDRYGDYIVLQLSSAGIEAFRDQIVTALIELFEPAGILARNDAGSREREGLVRETVLLHGEVPEEIEVTEYGIHYFAAPWTGQKTGAFLDQRENRHMIGELARGAALDCFSYHGSFALHLARGADRVTSLDSSAAALDRAGQNAKRNDLSNIDFVTADAFDFLRDREKDGTMYDTIVLDPPAFAKNKPSLPGAVRGYKDINMRAMRLLAPGGLLFTASCSFHLTRPLFLDMLRDAAADSGRRIVLRELTGQAIDHPEVVTIPETGYLKGALLEAAD